MNKNLTIVITTLTTLSIVMIISIIAFHQKYYYYSYTFKNGSGSAFQQGKYFDFNSARKYQFNQVGEISIVSFQEITREEFINANN